LMSFPTVHGPGALIRFGYPLFAAHGAHTRGTTIGRGSRDHGGRILSTGGDRRCCKQNASQPGNANLTNHLFSFDALHADPGRHRAHSPGQDRTTNGLNVFPI
jgi:hypothetical protein